MFKTGLVSFQFFFLAEADAVVLHVHFPIAGNPLVAHGGKEGARAPMRSEPCRETMSFRFNGNMFTHVMFLLSWPTTGISEFKDGARAQPAIFDEAENP